MKPNINDSFDSCKHKVCFSSKECRVNFLFMNEEAKRVEQQYHLLGMTAPEFQRAVGIQSQHWTNWKNRGIPKDKLSIVSKIIGKPVDWILTGNATAPQAAIDIAGLMPYASPATQEILKTLERGLKEGRLTQDDIQLLETIAKRLIASGKQSASPSYGKLLDEAKKNNPVE